MQSSHRAFYILHDVDDDTYSRHLIRAERDLDIRNLFIMALNGNLNGPTRWNRSIIQCPVDQNPTLLHTDALNTSTQQKVNYVLIRYKHATPLSSIQMVSRAKVGRNVKEALACLHRKLHGGLKLTRKSEVGLALAATATAATTTAAVYRHLNLNVKKKLYLSAKNKHDTAVEEYNKIYAQVVGAQKELRDQVLYSNQLQHEIKLIDENITRNREKLKNLLDDKTDANQHNIDASDKLIASLRQKKRSLSDALEETEIEINRLRKELNTKNTNAITALKEVYTAQEKADNAFKVYMSQANLFFKFVLV